MERSSHGEDLTMKLSGGISPRQSRGSAHLVVNAPLNTRIELKQDFTPRGKKGVQVESILRVEDLSIFESLLPPPIARSIQFNWKDFALDWSAEGEWKNLLVVKPDFQIGLVPNWEQSWSGFHRSRLQIAHVDWEGMGMAVRLPGLTWSADATVKSGAVEAETALNLEAFEFQQPGQRFPAVVENFSAAFQGSTTGPLQESLASLKGSVKVANVVHSALEATPVRNLELRLDGTLEEANRLVLKEGFFGNEGSGTRVELTGLLDGLRPEKVVVDELGIPGRQNAVLEGRLKQDFSAIQLSLEEVELSGKAAFPFRLTSGDFNVFRISGVLEAEQLSKTPEAGIHNLNGAIPPDRNSGLDRGNVPVFVQGTSQSALGETVRGYPALFVVRHLFALDELVIG